MSDCIETLVGISDNDNAAFATGRPAAYNTSTSGYYLTDADYGFPMLSFVSDAQADTTKSLWDILTSARSKALTQLRTDLPAKARMRHRAKFSAWSGKMGKLTHSGAHANMNTHAGHVIRPPKRRGASLVLTHVWLGLDTAQTVTVTVASNDPEFSTVTQSVTTGSGALARTAFASPVTLPFYSDNTEEELQYYVSYEVPEGAQVLDTAFSCCAVTQKYERIFRIGGFSVDTVDDDNVGLGGNSAYGMSLEGYYSCDELEWLCDMSTLAPSAVQEVVARAVQANAASIAAYSVANSTQVARGTTWQVDEVLGKGHDLKQAYEQHLDWLVQNWPSYSNGCLECKSARNFSKQFMAI